MSLKASLLEQPKSFWVLLFGELWCTFSYFGTQTILVLYLTHIFHFTHADSYLLYGAYAALAYSLPILGGLVADKYLGTKNAVILGSSFSVVGNLILALPFHYLFCLGLAISLLGSALYKSSATHLIGSLYQVGNIKKEEGYTLLYLAINIGGALSPLVYGFVTYKINWGCGFICSALGIFTSLCLFLKNKQLWITGTKSNISSLSTKYFLGLSALGVCLLLSITFYIPHLINLLIPFIFIISLIYLIISIYKQNNSARKRLLALLAISFFGMFYFAAGLQIGTTITLFIQSKIHQGVINTKLPASIFSTFYPFFVLLLAPCFTFLWLTLKNRGIIFSPLNKLAIGIMLAAIGISLFAFASITSYVITTILLGNIFLSAGEVALTPSVYTAISDLSPSGMKSTMMGCWLLFIALGGYLSSMLANASHFVTQFLGYANNFFNQFLLIAGFTLLVVLGLLFATPKLTKMMQ